MNSLITEFYLFNIDTFLIEFGMEYLRWKEKAKSSTYNKQEYKWNEYFLYFWNNDWIRKCTNIEGIEKEKYKQWNNKPKACKRLDIECWMYKEVIK